MIPVLSRSAARRRPVTAAYRAGVLADSPLYYWPMDDAAGATSYAALAGSTAVTAGTSTAQPTAGVTGRVDGTAVQFDGTNDFGSVALTLSGQSAIVVEWLMYWDAFADDDKLAMEYTPNYNNANGFIFDPDAGGTGSKFRVAVSQFSGGGVFNTAEFARPSAAAWHHYAVRLDRGAAAADKVVPYVDGVAVAYTKALSGSVGGTFADSTLYLMSRAGSSLFGAGRMQHPAIYPSLSAARILAHAQAAGF